MAGRQKKAGFSLIEVIFAVVFLSIIVFGVIKLQTSNLTLSNTQQNEIKAVFFTSQALEISEAIGFEAIKSCSIPEGYCTLKEDEEIYSLKKNGSEFLSGDLFSRKITHDETDLSFASLVTATVVWTDSSGDHNVSSKRIISK